MTKQTKALKQSYRNARYGRGATSLKKHARLLAGETHHPLRKAAIAWLRRKGGAS